MIDATKIMNEIMIWVNDGLRYVFVYDILECYYILQQNNKITLQMLNLSNTSKDKLQKIDLKTAHETKQLYISSINIQQLHLDDFINLQVLDISFNNISDYQCLSHLKLLQLQCSYCGLIELSQLPQIGTLKILGIKGNSLKSLQRLEKFQSLEQLNCANNRIENMFQCEQHQSLLILNIQNNPICLQKHFNECIKAVYPSMRLLNSADVSKIVPPPFLFFSQFYNVKQVEQQLKLKFNLDTVVVRFNVEQVVENSKISVISTNQNLKYQSKIIFMDKNGYRHHLQCYGGIADVPNDSLDGVIVALITLFDTNYIIYSSPIISDKTRETIKIWGELFIGSELTAALTNIPNFETCWYFENKLVQKGKLFTPLKAGEYQCQVEYVLNNVKQILSERITVDINKNEQTFLDSISLYYQYNGIPILCVGGSCTFYSPIFRQFSNVSVHWSYGSDENNRIAIKQDYDFVIIQQDFFDNFIFVELKLNQSKRILKTPTRVQRQINETLSHNYNQLPHYAQMVYKNCRFKGVFRVGEQIELLVTKQFADQFQIKNIQWFMSDIITNLLQQADSTYFSIMSSLKNVQNYSFDNNNLQLNLFQNTSISFEKIEVENQTEVKIPFNAEGRLILCYLNSEVAFIGFQPVLPILRLPQLDIILKYNENGVQLLLKSEANIYLDFWVHAKVQFILIQSQQSSKDVIEKQIAMQENLFTINQVQIKEILEQKLKFTYYDQITCQAHIEIVRKRDNSLQKYSDYETIIFNSEQQTVEDFYNSIGITHQDSIKMSTLFKKQELNFINVEKMLEQVHNKQNLLSIMNQNETFQNIKSVKKYQEECAYEGKMVTIFDSSSNILPIQQSYASTSETITSCFGKLQVGEQLKINVIEKKNIVYGILTDMDSQSEANPIQLSIYQELQKINFDKDINKYKLLSLNQASYTFQPSDANANILVFVIENMSLPNVKVTLLDFVNQVQIKNKIFLVKVNQIFMNQNSMFEIDFTSYEQVQCTMLIKGKKQKSQQLNVVSSKENTFQFQIPDQTEGSVVQVNAMCCDSKCSYTFMFPPIQNNIIKQQLGQTMLKDTKTQNINTKSQQNISQGKEMTLEYVQQQIAEMQKEQDDITLLIQKKNTIKRIQKNIADMQQQQKERIERDKNNQKLSGVNQSLLSPDQMKSIKVKQNNVQRNALQFQDELINKLQEQFNRVNDQPALGKASKQTSLNNQNADTNSVKAEQQDSKGEIIKQGTDLSNIDKLYKDTQLQQNTDVQSQQVVSNIQIIKEPLQTAPLSSWPLIGQKFSFGFQCQFPLKSKSQIKLKTSSKGQFSEVDEQYYEVYLLESTYYIEYQVRELDANQSLHLHVQQQNGKILTTDVYQLCQLVMYDEATENCFKKFNEGDDYIFHKVNYGNQKITVTVNQNQIHFAFENQQQTYEVNQFFAIQNANGIELISNRQKLCLLYQDNDVMSINTIGILVNIHRAGAQENINEGEVSKYLFSFDKEGDSYQFFFDANIIQSCGQQVVENDNIIVKLEGQVNYEDTVIKDTIASKFIPKNKYSGYILSVQIGDRPFVRLCFILTQEAQQIVKKLSQIKTLKCSSEDGACEIKLQLPSVQITTSQNVVMDAQWYDIKIEADQPTSFILSSQTQQKQLEFQTEEEMEVAYLILNCYSKYSFLQYLLQLKE